MVDSPPQMLGRYQLLALLATGGMAEIHLARQTGIQGFERIVVVKKILSGLAQQRKFLEMFLDEARLAAKLYHPNVVQVFDLGVENDEYYLAMEYLEGESLGYLAREAMRSGLVMPPEIAAGIIAQACDGLHYAHTLNDENGNTLNIVHRDVCPNNIIVLFSGIVKIVDFGIAKATTQMHRTQEGTLKGKFCYMSPEQVLAKPLDGRSDLHALGMVFWELLTRRRAYQRPNEAATLHSIVTETLPPVRTLRPEVSPEMESIVMRAVEKNPDKRFQTADEMGRALREMIRRSGMAASVQDVATFMHKVFRDRARTKKKLLEEIRASNGKRVSLGLLKPVTDESMPSYLPDEDDIPWATAELDEDGTFHVDDDPTVREPMPVDPEAEGADAALPPTLPEESPQPAAGHRRLFYPALLVFFLAFLAGSLLWLITYQEQDDATTKDERQGTKHTTGTSGATDRDAGARVDGGLQAASSADRRPQHVPSPAPDASTGDTEEQAPAPAHGYLRLNTKPWSRVFLNRRRLGITPLVGIKLPVGTHHLTAVNPEQKLRKSFEVEIKPGKTTIHWLDLRKKHKQQDRQDTDATGSR